MSKKTKKSSKTYNQANGSTFLTFGAELLHKGRSFRIKKNGIWKAYLKMMNLFSEKEKEVKKGFSGEGV